MQTMTTTLDELLDQAVEQMSRGQKRRFVRRSRLPGYRETYVKELADNLVDDPRFVECCPMGAVAMGTAGFTGSTQFQIDGSRLKAILDLIIEYAPKLLDIILLFINAFSSVLVFLAVSGSTVCAATINPLSMDPITLAAEIAKDKAEQARLARVVESDRHILAQWGKLVGNCPGGVCPLPAPSSNLQRVSYTVQPAKLQPVVVESVAVPQVQNYQRQWYNHDGMSLRQHAEVMHGHSTAGLSDAQVAYLNDQDHNAWGHGGHPSASRVSYGGHSHAVRFPVARATVVGSGRIVGGVARVVTAPVRYVRTQQPVRTFFRNRQPVRRVVRGTARAINSIRPVNIIRRARGCY